MGPQAQPKCSWHPKHMRNNWESRKRGYLIRFGHTEALLLKKKYDIKQPFFPPCRNWPICVCHKVMDQNQGSTNESIKAIALVLILHVGRVRWKQGSILNFTTYVGFAAGVGISFIPSSNIYFIPSSNIYSLPCLAVSDCQNSKPSCLISSQFNLYFKWDWVRMGKS